MNYELNIFGTNAVIEHREDGVLISLDDIKLQLERINKQRVIEEIRLGGIHGTVIKSLDVLTGESELNALVLDGYEKTKKKNLEIKEKERKKKEIVNEQAKEVLIKQNLLKKHDSLVCIDDVRSKSRFKIISKKQTFIFELSVFIVFFIQAIFLPDDLMSYSWAQGFVNLMGGIFPVVDNFYHNTYVNINLAFLYAQMCFLYVFFLFYYFFVNLGIVTDPSKVNVNISYETKLVCIFGSVLLFSLVLPVIIFLTMGEAGETGYYGRYERIYYSKFGAITFSYLTLCTFFPKSLHFMYKVYQETVDRQIKTESNDD